MHTPTREFGITGGSEGGHLLVTGLDELRVVVCASERRYQAVDSVPGIGIDMLDSPLAQAFQYEVCDLFSHCAPFRVTTANGGVRSHWRVTRLAAFHSPSKPRAAWGSGEARMPIDENAAWPQLRPR